MADNYFARYLPLLIHILFALAIGGGMILLSAVGQLLAWNHEAVQGVKFDRGELSIYVERTAIRGACERLKSDPLTRFNFFCDVTCVDWHPSEPRFELSYHLLSHARRDRVR